MYHNNAPYCQKALQPYHYMHWTVLFSNSFYSIMIDTSMLNSHKIVKCPMMSEITLNISIHGSNYIKLLDVLFHLISDDKKQCIIIFFALQKLIAVIFVFHISQQYAIISEITLNVSLHRSNCTKLLTHFIP